MTTTLSKRIIATFAGNGEPGCSGDGGPAPLACFNEPKGVTIDGRGHIYVADSENHVVRRIDRATGIVSTVAGRADHESATGIVGQEADARLMDHDPFADQMNGSAGQNYTQHADVSGTVRYWINGGAVQKRYGGDGGPAVQAQLNFPTAVVIDHHGHLYIADTLNHRIRRVDAVTGVISTLVGTGQPRFSGDQGPASQASLNEPAALALDGQGNLYIADQGNHRVRVVDLEANIIRTVAGTGMATYDGDGKPASSASLSSPSGLAIDGERLYIADTFNGRVRCMQLTSGLISTAAGDGGTYRFESGSEAPSPSLSRPIGIVLDREGRLFLTDSDSHLVRYWDWKTGTAIRVAGSGVATYSGDGGFATEASLCYPFGIAVDHDGVLFVADTFNHRIRTLSLE